MDWNRFWYVIAESTLVILCIAAIIAGWVLADMYGRGVL